VDHEGNDNAEAAKAEEEERQRRRGRRRRRRRGRGGGGGAEEERQRSGRCPMRRRHPFVPTMLEDDERVTGAARRRETRRGGKQTRCAVTWILPTQLCIRSVRGSLWSGQRGEASHAPVQV
jgi:hypothetical protein